MTDLDRDRRGTMVRSRWHTGVAVGAEGFPPGMNVELLAASGGVFRGRFLMTEDHGARPTLGQWLLDVALAGQAGAALGPGQAVDQR